MASTRDRVVLRGVSFSYVDSAPVLESIDVSFGRGWTGIVGPNGGGKSTLLGLITGALAPTVGEIGRPLDALVIATAQRTDGSIASSFFTRDDREAVRSRASLALDELVDGSAAWPRLSAGERRRWQLAEALAAAPDVLILDEPTNHLDAVGRDTLLAALRSFRGIGLVVSHDRTFLDALTTETVRVERGMATVWSGSYSVARARWEEEAEAAAMAREEQRRRVVKAERALDEARRERAAADRSRSTSSRMRSKYDSDARTLAAATKAAWAEAGAGRAVGRRHTELARESQRLDSLGDVERARGRDVMWAFERASRRHVLQLDGARVAHGDRVLLDDVRVVLGREERVRLAASNGAGKSSLLRVLVASAADDPRVLFVPQEIEVSRVRQAIERLRALPSDRRGRALSLLAALGADPARVLASASLSPGQARQLLLAEGLGMRAHTLVLDEPTNDLDLPAIERLEDALASFPGALLVVTHDDALAERLALDEWRLEGRRLIARPRDR